MKKSFRKGMAAVLCVPMIFSLCFLSIISASAVYSFLFPVENGRIAYYYGYSASYGANHTGIDIHSSGNDTIYAACDGVVDATANSCYHVSCGYQCEHYSTYGNYIRIRNTDGTYAYYGHLLQNSLLVSTGTTVKKGQAIAQMGSSGYSTGKHLHFEVRLSNRSTTVNVNPTSNGGSVNYSYSGYGGATENNPPVISYQRILAYDSGGYMLQCYVTDDTGVSSVKAATWTSKNGQDDLIWETMVNTEANTWKLYVPYSNHNNEIGSYVNHIYAYDIQGNETSSEVVFCNDFEPPKITDARIKAQDKNGYLISCKAEDNLGISNVKAAVWTLNNGQDDLIWDNMVNNGNGIWELYIPYKSHNCEEGFYRTHIYAYDENSNSCSFAVDDLLVSIDIDDYIPSNTAYYDNTKYEYFNYNTTWKQAEKICNLYGGHLVTITSQGEQDFINQLISNYSNQFCWVGATDENSEGTWKWITGEEFNFTNWAINEPNNTNGEENYMHLNNSGHWNDIHYTGNEYTFGFICEYDKIDSNDYIPFQSIEFDGKKYEFFDYSLTWEQASDVCEEKGGHLVTIGSDKENDIIWNIINSSSIEKFWIGATDKITESHWEWITGEPIEYTNWNSEEPNNSKGFENYAEIISSSGKWNDVYNYANINSLKYGFICETELKLSGDTNSDGKVNLLDAVMAQKAALSMTTLDEQGIANADMNGDGRITLFDAIAIQKLALSVN